MNKKYIFIFCACILGLLIIILIPKNVDEINDAVVNHTNGDIAICYFDYSGAIDVMRITVFDKYGEKLYSKAYREPHPAHMVFDGTELCVVVGSSYKKHIFDREGNETYNNISTDDILHSSSFEKWDYSWIKNQFSYFFNDFEYCYEAPSIFRHEARLTIKNGENIKVIYKSP